MSNHQSPDGSRSRGGKTVGVVVGVVVVLAVLAGGAFYFLNNGDGGGKAGDEQAADSGGGKKGGGDQPADDTRYKLTTPKSVGTLKRLGSKNRGSLPSNAKRTGITGTSGGSVQATYRSAGSGKMAIFGGIYGRIADPEATLDRVFRRQKIAGREVHPSGMDDAVVKCGKEQDPAAMECNWADRSTYGTLHLAAGGPSKERPLTLSEASGLVAQFYKQTRQPL